MSSLEATAIAYRYPNSDFGLAHTTLSVHAGEFVHVEGPSGCGKSTLARCLTGLIPHLYRGELHGDVMLAGLRTTGHPLWQLAEQVGMVFQNPSAQMLGISVEEEIVFGLENLGLPREAIRSLLDAALERFDLAAMCGRSPQTLSGGEQQKLALAAIMARQPAILVLDEPFSMLDVTTASELVSHLAALSQMGTSVIVFEHRAEFLDIVPGLRRISLNGHQSLQDMPWPDQMAELRFREPLASFKLVADGLAVELGGQAVLDGLSFSASGGETVAIVGRNGTGKTTLLRALAGLQKHQGSVTVNDERPDLGMVFQNPDHQLFNATVREEILYRIPEPDLALYRQVLNTLGLTRYENTPPLLLSEGEKKRVALATVLVRQPRHGILLDEPSLGQDVAHKRMLIRVAKALNRAGLLALMTTHDLPLAAQADRIILLGPDGITTDGPPEQILRDTAAWQRIGLHVPDWVRTSNRGGWQ